MLRAAFLGIMSAKVWHFLNTNSGAVQAVSAAVVAVLTLILARSTVRYVRLTKRIAAASVTQAEAVHKPLLTLRQDETQVVEFGKRISDALQGQLHTSVGKVLEVVNIGTGPALQVKWTLRRGHPTGGFIPYIQVGQSVSLLVASKVKMAAVDTRFEFECRYLSLSGTKYVSRKKIENSQEISSFEVSVEAKPD